MGEENRRAAVSKAQKRIYALAREISMEGEVGSMDLTAVLAFSAGLASMLTREDDISGEVMVDLINKNIEAGMRHMAEMLMHMKAAQASGEFDEAPEEPVILAQHVRYDA